MSLGYHAVQVRCNLCCMAKADYEYAKSGLRLSLNNLKGQWFVEQGTDPEFLYHYTTPPGLLGILSTKRLWASNLRYLNDYSEMEYARNLIVEIIRAKLETTDSPVVNEFLTCMQNFLLSELDQDVYGVCFCREGNLLSQWRAYAAIGGGYSIEFEVKKMYAAHMPYRFVSQEVEKLYQRDDLNQKFYPALKRVIYDEPIQRNLIGTAVDEFCSYLRTVSNWWEETGQPEYIIPLSDAEISSIKELAKHVLAEVLLEYIFCFKSPTFKEEHEWRIIYTPGEEETERLKFRASGNYIIPHQLEHTIT